MIIYLIRHGETTANAQKEFAGFTDVMLTEKGIKQAADVALKMKDFNLCEIVSSDLIRAKETAKAIGKHHKLEVVLHSQLREMNFGNWEGKKMIEIKQEAPSLLDQWFADFQNFQVPNGESVVDVYNRVTKIYDEIISKYDLEEKKEIAIIAHGGVIQILLSYLCYGDLTGYWRFGIDNCGINKIEYVMGFPVIKAINQ